MALPLGLLIFSFLITSLLVIPFINLLYKIKLQRLEERPQGKKAISESLFYKMHLNKVGTPVGGGLLIIVVVCVLYALLFPLMSFMGVYISSVHPIKDEINIIFFTFISFGLLGLYDDIMKSFGLAKEGVFGLRMRHKFLIQWVLALIIAFMLYKNLNMNFVYIPFFQIIPLGPFFIPFAAFVIVAFANAFNITDGLDGLAGGLLLIYLFAFWIISHTILDTVLSVFIPLWIGALMAFLYFNVYPARIWMGDVGALSFGATLAVVGLLVGKIMAVVVIGGLFILEVSSSMLQMISKKYFGRKIFPIAPFHLTLQSIGWEEPKIVMRAWLAGLVLAIFGLWLAVI